MPSHQWPPSPLVASLFFHWGIWLLVECMYWWLGSYSYQRLSGSIWLWLTFVHLYHSSHWPVGYSNMFRCPVYLLFCILVASSLQSRSPPLSLQPFSHTYPVQMTSWCTCCRSLWAESISHFWNAAWCHPCTVADGDSTPNSISASTLSDDLTYGVNAYAEQQWGQCITLVYSTLDGNLYLGVVQDNNCVLFHSSCWMDWSTLIYMCGTLNHRLSCSKSRQCSG